MTTLTPILHKFEWFMSTTNYIKTTEERQSYFGIFLIEKKETTMLDIKKLEGDQGQYRARVGKYRVIFKKGNGQNIIMEVSLRNEKTYHNLS